MKHTPTPWVVTGKHIPVTLQDFPDQYDELMQYRRQPRNLRPHSSYPGGLAEGVYNEMRAALKRAKGE